MQKTVYKYNYISHNNPSMLSIPYVYANEMLQTMFPNDNTLSNICLAIPVNTTSTERSFAQMKPIKTPLRNRIGERSLSYLMKISTEMPERL